MNKIIGKRKLNRLIKLKEKLELEESSSKKIELISDSLRDVVKADRCSIFIHDNNAKSLWSIYVDGLSEIEVKDNIGIVSKVYNTKKSIIVNDTQNSEYFNDEIDKTTGYVTKSIISMPIIGKKSKVLGVIELINKLDKKSLFTEEDEKILNYVMQDISDFLEIIYKEINC